MKQEPTISLYCDECGEIEEFSMVLLAGGDWDDCDLEEMSTVQGWSWHTNDKHSCPDCKPCEWCGEQDMDCDCCCVCEIYPCICEEDDDDDA